MYVGFPGRAPARLTVCDLSWQIPCIPPALITVRWRPDREDRATRSQMECFILKKNLAEEKQDCVISNWDFGGLDCFQDLL